MEPQVIAAIISGSIGAFAGITRALGNFNKSSKQTYCEGGFSFTNLKIKPETFKLIA